MTIESDHTAEVLQAAASAGAKTNEATFTVSAVSQSGKLISGAPVQFFIGPMVALSNVAPKSWSSTANGAASHYVAASSSTTNSSGHATLTLYGQPSGSMEMIGVQIGQVSSFGTTSALGSMDAWWTIPSAANAAPIGASVTTSVLAAKVPGSGSQTVSISAQTAAGPLSGAKVMVINKSLAGSSSATQTLVTGSSGTVSYPVTFGAATSGPSKAILRVVVTQPNGQRVAGGMNVYLTR